MKEKHFKATRIIHFALSIEVLLFAFVIFLLHDFKLPKESLDETFIIVNSFMLLAIPIGILVRKRMIESISPNTIEETRIIKIRTANITLWALCTGTTLFALVSFLLFYHYAYLVFAGFGYSALIATRPKSDIFN